MLKPWYDIEKAAQASAFFALKAGGRINILKLAKLLYEAERESMRSYDEPMFYDDLMSLPKGPVTSITLNLLRGENENDIWSHFMSDRVENRIAVASGINLQSLDHLSVADCKILQAAWDKHIERNQFEMVDYMHDEKNIPEWEDPQGSSSPISHEKVFEKLGKPHSKELAAEVEAYKKYKRMLTT